MNKTYLYLAMLAVFGVAAYFLIFHEDKSTIQGDDTAFAVEDTSEVSKIFLADKSGHNIILTRTEQGWVVNNKYPARPDAVRLLLSTMKRVKVSYSVPQAQHNMVVRDMAGESVKVEVYNKKDKRIKSYFVGGPTSDHKGTYFLMEGAKQPYVVAVPGQDAFLTPRYFTTLSDWRNRKIFQHQPNEIRELEVRYPLDESMGFIIKKVERDSFTIMPAAKSAGAAEGDINQRRIISYLQYYRKIHAAALEPHFPHRDSLLATISPFAIFKLTDTEGETHQVKLFHIPVKEGEYVDDQGNPMPYHPELYFALINERDFATVQDFVFRKLFRNYYDFLNLKEQPV